MSFTRFNFRAEINEALSNINFENPTEIQEKVIPLVLEGKDVIGHSHTGSGKTHAFLLPIINEIEIKNQIVQAVITSPTRELARQIYDFALELIKNANLDIKVKLFVGGVDKSKAIDKLGDKQPHIVIGTPGRITDLAINENILKIYTSKIFVVDEADMTLETGFLQDIDKIASTMGDKLQMLVFSATIPNKLQPFLQKYMSNPIYVKLDKEEVTPDKLEHILIPTRNKDKKRLLLRLLKIINPYIAIVFVNKKETVPEIVGHLKANGYDCGIIHGGLSPRERKNMMKRIKNLEYQYIVATDIAARGLDIEGVTHIINYELPFDYEFYIHRCGRTARNKYDGIAFTFYDREDDTFLDMLEKKRITFSYKDILEDELVESKVRNQRKKREKGINEAELEARKRVRKPKKVKPGYKKKMKEQIEKEKRNIKRTQRRR